MKRRVMRVVRCDRSVARSAISHHLAQEKELERDEKDSIASYTRTDYILSNEIKSKHTSHRLISAG